ncbi:MAG: hypothetical protein GKR93_17750 [Gammaproteobacteria bacterium]|nr:hypothetical protein [Gammaproteobacteria bacterium]
MTVNHKTPTASTESKLPERGLFLIVTLTKFIGVLGLLLMPLQIGGFIEGLGLGETRAGMLATAEVFSLGGGLILVSLGFIKLPLNRLAIIGGIIVVIGYVLSIFVEYYPGLVLARAITGLGMGFINAAATMAIATCFVDTDRTAGNVFALVYLGSAVLYLATPFLSQFGHYQGLFTLLIIIVTLAMPLFRLLPKTNLGQIQANESNENLPWLSIILLLAGEAILFVGLGTCWGFAERLGINSGLDAKGVSFYLAWSVVATIIGATFAGWLGTRMGRSPPLLGGALLTSLACVLMASTGMDAAYLPGLMLYQATTAFLIPYLIGTAALLDSNGRVAAAVVGTLIFCYGGGAALGGWVIENFSLSALGWVALTCAALAFIIFISLLSQLQGNQPGKPSAL